MAEIAYLPVNYNTMQFICKTKFFGNPKEFYDKMVGNVFYQISYKNDMRICLLFSLAENTNENYNKICILCKFIQQSQVRFPD